MEPSKEKKKKLTVNVSISLEINNRLEFEVLKRRTISGKKIQKGDVLNEVLDATLPPLELE